MGSIRTPVEPGTLRAISTGDIALLWAAGRPRRPEVVRISGLRGSRSGTTSAVTSHGTKLPSRGDEGEEEETEMDLHAAIDRAVDEL
jgi:hypothetical protein